MFTNFIEWRKKNKINNIALELQNEDFSDLKKFYHHGWHGIDKLGRPIYLERGGLFDGDEIVKLKGPDWMTKYSAYVNEDKMNFRFPVCSEKAGKKI